jgi:two-component system cell cycle sensor histidine kinase/response regulator CckA
MPRKEAQAMTRDSRCGTILVVDDNLEIRSFTKRFLETAGWTVVTAADGQEGLRFFEEHQSRIVLLLTDVVMPNINGLELADRVLGMDHSLPVLFMSGDTGCNYRGLECVAKPFRPDELLDKVTQVLNTNAHSERNHSAA